MLTNRHHEMEYADFTEANYRRLLRLAKLSYRFIEFPQAGDCDTILWRHDCDASMHRAVKLAEIEAEEDVKATYFLLPRCRYYNLLSADVAQCVRRIMSLGHDIALHFDPTYYGENLRGPALLQAITRERDLIAAEFGKTPVAISFHLFGILDQSELADDIVAGMINAYGRSLAASYAYVSDSNGVWRHRRLSSVLEDATDSRLQVLTHPEWWTPDVMAPRSRLQRAIDGYAIAMGRWYDDITARHGRPNIR